MTALTLIQATVEPGVHTLESLGFQHEPGPGHMKDRYVWGRLRPSGSALEVVLVNTSPHIPDNPPSLHYALLGAADFTAPRLGPGGYIGFLKALKSELIQTAKTSSTWTEFRDTVKAKHHKGSYVSLSNQVCEDFWSKYHGNNVVATVEPEFLDPAAISSHIQRVGQHSEASKWAGAHLIYFDRDDGCTTIIFDVGPRAPGAGKPGQHFSVELRCQPEDGSAPLYFTLLETDLTPIRARKILSTNFHSLLPQLLAMDPGFDEETGHVDQASVKALSHLLAMKFGVRR